MKRIKKFFCGPKGQRACSVLMAAVCVAGLCCLSSAGAYATSTAFITGPFDTLKTIISSIISAIGTILTLWGISEFGIAMQSQDGTSQAHAFKRMAGGLVITMAPQIVTLF